MAAIFGFSFLFTKTALASLAPADLLGFRFALAAVALTILAAAGLVHVDLSRWRWVRLLPLAAIQPVAYFFCETGGVKLTSASEAGAIIGTIPVVVAILAAVVLGERPGFLQILFILASPLGVALMAAGGGFGGSHLGGMLLLLGAVLAAGIYSILSRHHSKDFNPVEITMVMMWLGAVVFNAVALGGHLAAGSAIPWPVLARPSVWVPLGYLGLLSSVGAFFLVNFMLGRMEAARSVAYTNLTTLVSVLAGVLIFRERFYWYQGIGGLLILIGVWGTNRFGRSAPVMPLAAGE